MKQEERKEVETTKEEIKAETLTSEETKQDNKKPYLVSDYEMNQNIANYIIETIESGNVEKWRKTWLHFNGLEDLYIQGKTETLPIMLFSKEFICFEKYGLDALSLKGGFYMTFKEIKQHKLHLNKGSKGHALYKPSYFEKRLTKDQEDGLQKAIDNGDENIIKAIEELNTNPNKRRLLKFEYINSKTGEVLEFFEECFKEYGKIKYKRFQYVLFYVYNNKDLKEPVDVAKLWGIDESKIKFNNIDKIEKVEEVKADYINRANLKYKEDAQDRAYYSPALHMVHLPLKDTFETSEDYYQTMMHEFAHSTGHNNLLNRKTLTAQCGFRTKTYAKEELVAELSSLYTLSALKLMNDDILKNSIAYLKSWGDELKTSIKHNIIATIRQSTKATNLILNIQDNKEGAR